jgi:hypothetical protein
MEDIARYVLADALPHCMVGKAKHLLLGQRGKLKVLLPEARKEDIERTVVDSGYRSEIEVRDIAKHQCSLPDLVIRTEVLDPSLNMEIRLDMPAVL